MSYNPFEVPQKPDDRAGEAEAGGEAGPVLADRWERFAGAFVDGIAMSGISLASQFASGMFSKLSTGTALTVGDQLLQSLIGVVAFLLVHGYLLINHGQTVGKWLMGTRIVDAKTAALLPFTRVYIVRYMWLTPLALVVPFVPPGATMILGSSVGFINLLDSLLIFGKDRRCLHDYLAGSIVVRARRRK